MTKKRPPRPPMGCTERAAIDARRFVVVAVDDGDFIERVARHLTLSAPKLAVRAVLRALARELPP